MQPSCYSCGQLIDLVDETGAAVVDCPYCGAPLQFTDLSANPADNGLNPDDEYRKPWQDRTITAASALIMLAIAILWILFPSLRAGAGGGAGAVIGNQMSGPASLEENPAIEFGAMGNPDRRRNPGNDQKAAMAGEAVSRADEGEMSLPENSGSRSALEMDENLGSLTLADLPRMTNIVMLSDSFEARLAAAGARSGDIRISLMWNNVNDLDLHVFDPLGDQIFYQNRKVRSGGELDIDRNAQRPLTQKPVENVYWPEKGAPSGRYRVFVHHYRNNGAPDPTRFVVRVLVRGKSKDFTGIVRAGERPKLVHEFRVAALR